MAHKILTLALQAVQGSTSRSRMYWPDPEASCQAWTKRWAGH
jgi:hypothetical protein